MKEYIELWRNMIIKESGELSETEESLPLNMWYATPNPKQYDCEEWIRKFGDKYAILSKKKQFLKIIQDQSKEPIGYTWVVDINCSTPFHSKDSIKKFLKSFSKIKKQIVSEDEKSEVLENEVAIIKQIKDIIK